MVGSKVTRVYHTTRQRSLPYVFLETDMPASFLESPSPAQVECHVVLPAGIRYLKRAGLHTSIPKVFTAVMAAAWVPQMVHKYLNWAMLIFQQREDGHVLPLPRS